jgi:glutaconate CoA-transferase subunit B
MAVNTRELMVVAAAREVRDREVVFVGMRLPLLGFLVAKATHAPSAVGLFENGVLRDLPASAFLVTMSDPPNILGATACMGLNDVMALLQRGRVDLGFLGGAEIDRFGNLNTTQVEGTRLPGSGGAADIASLAKRFVVVMQHEARRFRLRVSYRTSPGYGDGPGWRRRVGLPGGGPATVITTLGVFEFDSSTCAMAVRTLHPGVAPEAVRAATGWPIDVPADPARTPEPTREEVAAIRRFDPEGFWTAS